MNRIDIKSKKSPNFIGCWYLEDKNISKKIIDFFENNKHLQKKGSTAKGVEESRKKTTDITISPNKLTGPKYKVFQDYFSELQKCFFDYRDQWPFVKQFLTKVNIGPFNVLLKGNLYKDYDEKALKEYMRNELLDISVDIGLGRKSFKVFTMDLTKEYVEINSDYRS